MLYILFAPFALILADLLWITFNTHKGIYSHLRNDSKLFFSITEPFRIPLSVVFRSPDLSLVATITCTIVGWTAPILYLLLKIDTDQTTGSYFLAALQGLELAAVVYSVFNATAYLTFPTWRRWVLYNTIPIALLDTMWGCALYTGTSVLAFELAQW